MLQNYSKNVLFVKLEIWKGYSKSLVKVKTKNQNS